MDAILEPILALLDNPLTNFLKNAGLGEDWAKALSAALTALMLWGGVEGVKWLQQRRKDNRAARELVHFRYSYKDVQQKRELYIPTQGQNNSPVYEEEPGEATKFIVKKPLIPFFLKTAFNEKKESDKFYLLLGDSGMGKTTFMINLYLQYHSWRNFRRKYQMKLFPFGDKDILKWIREIKPEEARNTILLLDAFDEYKAILPPKEPDGLSDDERFRKVLEEIIESVKDFREVVISSRTQYFPGQEDRPYELKIPRFGREGFHTLGKLYLAPFEKKEIKRYLNKKYGWLKFWNYQKKKIASEVVESSPKLMVRPMLLSYIDYLVDSQQTFEKTHQIYQVLIEKWIEREADKRKHKSVERDKFKQDLHAFSRMAALTIFRQQGENNLLSKAEALAICTEHGIDLRDYEVTGQSLLTRDVSQNWKFAHKSIYEYFIAKEAIDQFGFWVKLAAANFTGMDMAKQFYEEGGQWAFVKGGTFLMGSPDSEKDAYDREKPQHKVTLSDYCIAKTPVTQKQWRAIMGTNPSYFQNCDNCPVETVSWEDVQKFIAKLNEKTGMTFRLPSEAEWEYAARGGHKMFLAGSEGSVHVSQFKYAGSNHLDTVGWYHKNSRGKTHPVATKKPNELGIYDMSGNVYEWCQDWYDENYYAECQKKGVEKKPSGPESGWYRVLRGGSWRYGAQFCRSANRDGGDPGSRDRSISFRLVFVP